MAMKASFFVLVGTEMDVEILTSGKGGAGISGKSLGSTRNNDVFVNVLFRSGIMVAEN